MGQAKQRGTREQRQEEARQRILEERQHLQNLINEDEEDVVYEMDEMDEEDDFPQMWWGYDRERKQHELPVEIPDDMVCMVSNITTVNQADINRSLGSDFQLGEWFVSTGRHEDSVVHGPFSTMDAAFNYAKDELGAIRFLTHSI